MKLLNHRETLFRCPGPTFHPAWRFSAHFGASSWCSKVLKNGNKALADTLRRQVGLWPLPRQWAVSNDGTSQVQYPDSQCHQPAPKVTRCLMLETRHVPSKALFAETDTRLDRPAMTVCLPDDLSSDLKRVGNPWRSLPSEPNGIGMLSALKMNACPNDIQRDISIALPMQVVPTFQLDLTIVWVFEY